MGLIALGRGRDAIGLSDLRIESRLSQYMLGGQEGSTAKEGLGALGDRGDEGSGNIPNRCSTLKEGAMVNVDVTAPGATLALGPPPHRQRIQRRKELARKSFLFLQG